MNLPNKLTLLRIVLVPVLALVWLFPYEQFDIAINSISINNVTISILNLVVLAIFAIASFTDFLDGNIARKRNMVTTFGKFADPIADKLLVDMMLIIMAYFHMIPVVCTIVMILRDLIVDGCRMVAAQKGVVVSAGFLGKMKTVFQMITIILTLLNNVPFEFLYIPVSSVLIWFTTFISVSSGYQYFVGVKQYIFESM